MRICKLLGASQYKKKSLLSFQGGFASLTISDREYYKVGDKPEEILDYNISALIIWKLLKNRNKEM